MAAARAAARPRRRRAGPRGDGDGLPGARRHRGVRASARRGPPDAAGPVARRPDDGVGHPCRAGPRSRGRRATGWRRTWTRSPRWHRSASRAWTPRAWSRGRSWRRRPRSRRTCGTPRPPSSSPSATGSPEGLLEKGHVLLAQADSFLDYPVNGMLLAGVGAWLLERGVETEAGVRLLVMAPPVLLQPDLPGDGLGAARRARRTRAARPARRTPGGVRRRDRAVR